MHHIFWKTLDAFVSFVKSFSILSITTFCPSPPFGMPTLCKMFSFKSSVITILANRPASRGTRTHFAQRPAIRPHRMKCLIYACFVLNSFFILQDGRQQETKTLESVWSSEKDFPIGPDSQNKHIFYRHPCQKVTFVDTWVEGKIG